MRRNLRAARYAAPVVILGATALWLYSTARPVEGRDAFFGLWRMRHMLPAAIAAWTSIGIAAALSVRTLRAFGTATVVTVLAVAILDVAGLVGVVNYPLLFEPRPKALGIARVPFLDIEGETYQDTATAWNVKQEALPFHFTTDHRGYRNAVDRKDADFYLLGDSILVAGLLPFEQTVAARLEAAWGRPVMNIALLAVGAQGERDMLEQADVDLKGRTVLQFMFEGNDLIDSSDYRKTSGRHAERGPLAHQLFSFQSLVFLQRISNPDRIDTESKTGFINGQPYLFEWLDDSFVGHMDEIEHVYHALLDTRRHVESDGGRYVLVYVPAKIRVLGPFCQWPEGSPLRRYEKHLNPLRELVASWCAEQKITLVDTTDAFLAVASAGNIPWFWGDTHPNAFGHEAMAQKIITALK